MVGSLGTAALAVALVAALGDFQRQWFVGFSRRERVHNDVIAAAADDEQAEPAGAEVIRAAAQRRSSWERMARTIPGIFVRGVGLGAQLQRVSRLWQLAPPGRWQLAPR